MDKIMYYGLDIGGSKIAFAAYDAQRRLRWQQRIATPHSSYHDFLHAIHQLVTQADQRFAVSGKVGIGIPGLPKTADGTLYAVNLPAANGQPVHDDLCRLLQRDVRMENDATCFALSEAWHDEFRRYPLVIGLILGSGVGGGIIANGKPLGGHNGLTGEFGHSRLPVDALAISGGDLPLIKCACGQTACIENYLSGGGFAFLYQHFYHEALDAPQIIQRWQQGERNALAHTERYLNLLAACLGSLLSVLDADLLVLGGGLSNFSALTAQLPACLPAYLLPVAKPPRIEKARYGDAGGVRGAAFLHSGE